LRRPLRDRLAERPRRRHERVDHGLVALAGGAEPLDACERLLQRGGQRGQVHLGGVSQGLSGPAEGHAVQRPGGAADHGDDGVARESQDLSGRRGRGHPPVLSVQGAEHGSEAAGEVDAVIGIADRRVQLGQVVAVGLDDLGGGGHPGPEEFSVHVEVSDHLISPHCPQDDSYHPKQASTTTKWSRALTNIAAVKEALRWPGR
jgi:hypothetical protein